MSTKFTKDQRGIVSLMVTLIMMVVVSLIVIGFSQVARRNQRLALDRQLSTQAYYAAETGVNDVVSAIKAGATTLPVDKTDCSSFATRNSLATSLDTAGAVKYSCLLVDNAPTSITYTTIANQQSVAVPVKVGSNLGSLTFNWKAPAGTALWNAATCSGGNLAVLPSSSGWGCSYGLLRVDLTKQPAGVPNAVNLAGNTFTAYLKPHTALGALTVSNFANQSTRARILGARCVAGNCTATINFSGAGVGTVYYMRLSGMYRDSASVVITGKDTAAGTETFSDAQVSIDSTGKAQDQLRRVQVRLPLQVSTIPTNALQTTGMICKTFVTGQNIPDPDAVATGATSLCPNP